MKKTILISSHILPELADLCNKVGIIEQGELLYSGPVTDIVRRAKTGTVLHVGVADGSAGARGRACSARKPSDRKCRRDQRVSHRVVEGRRRGLQLRRPAARGRRLSPDPASAKKKSTSKPRSCD